MKGYFANAIKNIISILERIFTDTNALRETVTYIRARGEKNMSDWISGSPIHICTSTDLSEQE